MLCPSWLGSFPRLFARRRHPLARLGLVQSLTTPPPHAVSTPSSQNASPVHGSPCSLCDVTGAIFLVSLPDAAPAMTRPGPASSPTPSSIPAAAAAAAAAAAKCASPSNGRRATPSSDVRRLAVGLDARLPPGLGLARELLGAAPIVASIDLDAERDEGQQRHQRVERGAKERGDADAAARREAHHHEAHPSEQCTAFDSVGEGHGNFRADDRLGAVVGAAETEAALSSKLADAAAELSQTTDWYESTHADLESEIEALKAAHATERDMLMDEHQTAHAEAAERVETAQAAHAEQVEDAEKLRIQLADRLSELQSEHAHLEHQQAQME